MSFDAVYDLLRITEYTAKKMLRSSNIPTKYSYASILVLLYLVFALFLPLDNAFFYLITLLSGFIGSTILTIYLIMGVYLFDQHLELTKYYYLNLRDLLKNIKNEKELENLNSAIEKLLLIDKIGIEYSPVTVIPAYTSLLLLHDKVYMFLFLAIYMIVCSLVVREIIIRYNEHVEKENMIEKELSKITSSQAKDYDTLPYCKIGWIILLMITFSVVLIYVINKVFKGINEHLAIHRSNYEYVKKYVVKITHINY